VIDLGVPSVAELHKRRSEKWALFDDDVLSATVAEMDFPIAAPISEVLHAAIDRNDLGYARPAPVSLCDAFAAFADRRLDWSVDPGQVTVVPGWTVCVRLFETTHILFSGRTARGGILVICIPAIAHNAASVSHRSRRAVRFAAQISIRAAGRGPRL
jgi:bifunctional pyridoxal-dependent enzyme with beta-cystathionase and maltose regulon repressor activities